MLNLIAHLQHNAELREAKHIVLMGQLVHMMAARGNPVLKFSNQGKDRQSVRFLMVSDPMVHAITITVERMTGAIGVADKLIGSKASFVVECELRHKVTDPEELSRMYRASIAEMVQLLTVDLGGIRVHHRLTKVSASTTKVVEINNYLPLAEESGFDKLAELLDEMIARLRVKLAEFKRPTT